MSEVGASLQSKREAPTGGFNERFPAGHLASKPTLLMPCHFAAEEQPLFGRTPIAAFDPFETSGSEGSNDRV
jgi:hypothetical protein